MVLPGGAQHWGQPFQPFGMSAFAPRCQQVSLTPMKNIGNHRIIIRNPRKSSFFLGFVCRRSYGGSLRCPLRIGLGFLSFSHILCISFCFSLSSFVVHFGRGLQRLGREILTLLFTDVFLLAFPRFPTLRRLSGLRSFVNSIRLVRRSSLSFLGEPSPFI